MIGTAKQPAIPTAKKVGRVASAPQEEQPDDWLAPFLLDREAGEEQLGLVQGLLTDLELDRHLPIGIHDDDEPDTQDLGDIDEALRLPSYLCHEPAIKSLATFRALAEIEMKLRTGQMNDALRRLRLKISHKSMRFASAKNGLQSYKSQQHKTRIWDDIRAIDIHIMQAYRSYRLARSAALLVAPNSPDLIQYKDLDTSDLRVNTYVLGPLDQKFRQRENQTKVSSSWFWHLANGDMLTTPEWMEECELPINTLSIFSDN